MKNVLFNILDFLGLPLNLICPPAHAQMSSFISPEIMNFVPIIFIFALMYFFILRPQSKKAKAHRDMLEALRRGDRVLTAGGIIGTIHKIENDQEVQVEIAQNIYVKVAKVTLSQVLAKNEPLKTDSYTTLSENLSSPSEIKELTHKKTTIISKKVTPGRSKAPTSSKTSSKK